MMRWTYKKKTKPARWFCLWPCKVIDENGEFEWVWLEWVWRNEQ